MGLQEIVLLGLMCERFSLTHQSALRLLVCYRLQYRGMSLRDLKKLHFQHRKYSDAKQSLGVLLTNNLVKSDGWFDQPRWRPAERQRFRVTVETYAAIKALEDTCQQETQFFTTYLQDTIV